MFFLRYVFVPVSLLALSWRSETTEEQLEDTVLIERIAAGDERALALFYDRYKGLIYSLMLQILGDCGQAEEVTLDAFTRIWQQAAVYRSSRAAVKTWLVSIARNRAIDILRMRRSRLDGEHSLWADESETESLSSIDNPEQNVAEQDLRSRVRKAIAELPEEQSTVLSLAYLSGLSHAEIAEKLQQPLGTVKGRIRKGMQTLQEYLTGEF